MGLLSRLIGRSDAAVKTARAAHPNADAPVRCRRGSTADHTRAVVSLVQTGKYADALVRVDASLEQGGESDDLFVLRADVLHAWGRHAEAVHWYSRGAAALDRTHGANGRAGWSALQIGDTSSAERFMRDAVALDPSSWEARWGLGSVLEALDRIEDANDAYNRAAELAPGRSEPWSALGRLRTGRHNADEAAACFQRAIDADVANVPAWVNLGVALGKADRHDEALQVLHHAFDLEQARDQPFGACESLAVELIDNGRVADGVALLEANLVKWPSVEGHVAMLAVAQRAGRWPESWQHNEFRWLVDFLAAHRIGPVVPPWTGQDLTGRKVLLRVEQGVGDVVQYLRYAKLLRQLGAKTLFRAAKGLDYDFLSGFEDIDELLAEDRSLPPFDFYANVMSLPHVFGTTPDSVPVHIPYLHARDDRLEVWRTRIDRGDGLRVGLVWAGNPGHGNDHNRSMRLEALAPLLDVSGVQFYSLQKGDPSAQLASLPEGRCVDLASRLDDYADTTAAIELLDLVIAVDTSVAHLAGALGKPVWMLIPHLADARWLEDREDTPWYPTMRLFRQRTRGDWADAVARLKASLELASREVVTFRARSDEARRNAAHAMPPMQPGPLPPPQPTRFSAVAETRYGIAHYLPDDPVVGESIRWYGEYLHSVVRLVESFLKPGSTIVETDSGVGIHALALAHLAGAPGALLCFEDRPVMRRLLRENLDANGHQAATVLKRRLRRSSELLPSVGSGDDVASAIAADPQDSIDDLHLTRLDLLKLCKARDACGILDGTAETLWRLRPAIVVANLDETDEQSVSLKLRSFGYRTWRFAGPLFDGANFYLRREDVFAGRYSRVIVGWPEEAAPAFDASACTEIT